jgi:hypothetical protein
MGGLHAFLKYYFVYTKQRQLQLPSDNICQLPDYQLALLEMVRMKNLVRCLAKSYEVSEMN